MRFQTNGVSVCLVEGAELFFWGPFQGCQTAVSKTGKTRLEDCQTAISKADKTRCLWPVWLVEGAELFRVLGPFQGCQTAVSKTGKSDWRPVKGQSRKPIKPDACGPCGCWKALNFSGFWGRFKAVKRQFRKPVNQIGGLSKGNLESR